MTEIPKRSKQNLLEKRTETRPIRIAGLASVNPELYIPDEQRLVPRDYKLDVAGAVVRVARDGHRGYPLPENRLKWTKPQIDAWVAAGRPTKVLYSKSANETFTTGTPFSEIPELAYPLPEDDIPPWYVGDHEERKAARSQGLVADYDPAQTYPPGTFGDTPVDSNGGPIHPFDEQMLLEGAVTGIGCNYNLKKKSAADPIAMIVKDGKLYLAVIGREDSVGRKKGDAFPGGKQEEGEDIEDTVNREFAEELDLLDHMDFVRSIPRLPGAAYEGPTADPRDTLNIEGRTTYAKVLLPTDEQAADPKLQTLSFGDDAVESHWMLASEANINNLWAMHPELAMLGIKQMQDITGLVVNKEGRVGRSVIDKIYKPDPDQNTDA